MDWFKQKWRQFRNYWFPPSPLEAPTTNVKWQVVVREPDDLWLKDALVTVLELTSGSPVVVCSGMTGSTGYFYHTPVGTPGVEYPYYDTLWFRAEVSKDGYDPVSEDFWPYISSSEFKPPPNGYFYEFRLYRCEVILQRKKVMELV